MVKLIVPQYKAKKKKTRKEDAESIVGKDLAELIERKAKSLDARSNSAMIEMSEAQPVMTSKGFSVRHAVEKSLHMPYTQPEKTALSVRAAVAKSMTQRSVEPIVTYPADEMPMGGAMSMEEAMSYQKRQAGKSRILDALQTFMVVVQNILSVPEVKDKQGLLQKALDDFSLLVTQEKLLAVLQKSRVSIDKSGRIVSKPLSIHQVVSRSVGLVA